jgi:hypothetical protein
MMTADERLAQIRPKVERAKYHINNLEREIQTFLATNPYKVGTKRDPQSRKLIYYVSSVAETNSRIPLIAGDAVQNLMSGLDHLAYQLVCVSTGDNPPKPHRIYFPIADTPAEYETEKIRKIEGARQDIVDAIDLIKPYKGGNDLLWTLYRLNNIDKHRLLITVGSMFQSVNLGAHMHASIQKSFGHTWGKGKTMPMLDLFVRPADTLFPLKVGDELFVDAVDAEVNERMQFRFNVALSEPQIIEAQSLIETLHQMANLVDGIITALESKLR